MTPLSMNSSLTAVDLTDTEVCKRIAEMLPVTGDPNYLDGANLLELIRETGEKVNVGTVADLVLELAIVLTGGCIVRAVEIDVSALAPEAETLGQGTPDGIRWTHLDLDLGRPDWTVAVSIGAQSEGTEPVAGTDGVLRVRVRADRDLRGWLTEEVTRAVLHGWYVQYQTSGILPSDRQMTQLPQPPSICSPRRSLASRSSGVSCSSKSSSSAIWRSSISVPPSKGAFFSHPIASSRESHSQSQ